MDEFTALQRELQEGRALTRELFLEHIRGCVQASVLELMEEEVQRLCGPRYRPLAAANCRRAGSEQGILYLEGEKRPIRRPRVRHRDADGVEREFQLGTYARVRKLDNIAEEVVGLVSEGVSARGVRRLKRGGPSKSTASRLWASGSAAKLEALRGRDLSEERFYGLVMDGIVLSRDLTVVVAVGLCCDGRKMVLDFSVGSSESYEVVHELLVRIRERGFAVEQRLLAILDGSEALRKAVREFWSDAVIQCCLVHVERNLHGYLRKRDHSECSRLLRRLRKAEGLEAATEAAAELYRWVCRRNQQARQRLEDLGQELLALHALNVPATLNVSLLSTNLIENAIKNYRRHTDRVNRWRSNTDQVERWTGAALITVENGFRRIVGYRDLPLLIAALDKNSPVSVPAAPFRTCPSGTPPGGGDVRHCAAGTPGATAEHALDEQPNAHELQETIR
jgi:transposase-like protein